MTALSEAPAHWQQVAPDHALTEALGQLHGQPAFIAGSAVAARVHGKQEYGDVDIFVPTQQVLVSVIQSLLERGYTMDDRFARVWFRWLRYGLKGWHTNSMRLESLRGVPTNVVYKLVDGHATTSLSQVLESFDFGLLGVGYETETGTMRDLRPYLFPTYGIDGALPMMPNKRDNWRQGFISQYNGLREGWRYGKYHSYGYDMSLVKDDLTTGYWEAADYLSNHFDQDKRQLGDIYYAIGHRIHTDGIDELITSYESIDFSDPLDKIMEALE
jgi:hypothetical protein